MIYKKKLPSHENQIPRKLESGNSLKYTASQKQNKRYQQYRASFHQTHLFYLKNDPTLAPVFFCCEI